MDFFDGGVPEHHFEFANKIVPVRVSISWPSGIPIVGDPEVFSSMGPPVLGMFDEERGGEDHHE